MLVTLRLVGSVALGSSAATGEERGGVSRTQRGTVLVCTLHIYVSSADPQLGSSRQRSAVGDGRAQHSGHRVLLEAEAEPEIKITGET